MTYLICRGGWPLAIDLDDKAALQQAKNYYKNITEVDMSRVDDVKRDSFKVQALMRAFSRNISTQASIQTLLNNLSASDNLLSDETVASYLNALKKIYIVDDLKSWKPNLRTKAAIRTSPTRHFVDPSIATAALGISPNDLLNDFKTLGLIFESMAIRDLRVYLDAIEGEVYHYRDSDNLECDAVLHLNNGNYALVEVKLSEHFVEEGVSTLKQLKEKINTTKMKEPSFLMVLTGDSYPYQRPDGVFVVSIASLKP